MDKLPEDTRTKLRSTQIITALPDIVSELFQNSLDAGATHVDIGVDCEGWSCWVKDDGSGMSKDDLAYFTKGKEGGRYGSSKAYTLDSLNYLSTFGFRGEALSSVADLSCLEISSRTSKSRESFSVIMKDGKCLYEGPSMRWRRESPGTVICVRDAFYNLPIRRLSHPSPSRTMELVRHELEAYALAFPGVSFSLKAESGEDSDPSKDKTFRIPKTNSRLATFRHLYGRALVQHAEEISDASGDMKIEGFISLEGAHSRVYQFLYINSHPITLCDLHIIIDMKFNNSSFAKHALDEAGDLELPRSTIRRSPRKAIRRPVYVLNIIIPPKHIDNCLEPSKSSVHIQDRTAVSVLLSSTIDTFLVKHGFLIHAKPKPTTTDDSVFPSPRKRRKRNHSSYEPLQTPLEEPEYIHINPEIEHDKDQDPFVWTDAKTGERYVVDLRTGNSFPLGKDPTEVEETERRHRQRRTLAPEVSLRMKGDNVRERSEMPAWIQNTLQQNDVYAVAQPRVRTLCLASSFLSDMDRHSALHACQNRKYPAVNAYQYSTPSSCRFTVQDLSKAQIIEQVDKKFIACLIECSPDVSNDCSADDSGFAESSDYSLVLIDQHAADERVRVERFLKSICSGLLCRDKGDELRVKELSPARHILLTRHEAERLRESDALRRAFHVWGFDFDLRELQSMDKARESGYIQVGVKTVPDVVSSKLLMDNELRELVKGYIAHLESTQLFPPSNISDEFDDSKAGWVKALRWCPQELTALINSKACRGAIMFNDPLSMTQCEKLLKDLSETIFPFQCAHGRPSLVPLANLGIPVNRRRERLSRPVDWEKLKVT